jgi:molecular chaperone GrpE
MSSPDTPEGDEYDEGVRVTDRRRIDPETGEVRASAVPTTDEAASEEVIVEEAVISEPDSRDVQVAELTADLQRVAAEYKNYRDRVQREISDARQRGRADVVTEMIATLDDLDRAGEHGDLTGPVKALADNLASALTRVGVERYGAEGEPFDPVVHEALTHTDGEGFDVATVTAVYQPGYRIGDRVIRAARVAVTE